VGKVKVKKKKVVKNKAAAGDEAAEGWKPAASKSEAEPFSRPGLFSKAKELQTLFSPLRDGEVNSEILRPRMQTESVEHGRGQGLLRGFTFRKFQDVPKAVVFMTAPSSKGGGAFEPAGRLLTVGGRSASPIPRSWWNPLAPSTSRSRVFPAQVFLYQGRPEETRQALGWDA
jgi:hypothetical protein